MSSKKKLYALIGHPVNKSLSPAIHNRMFNKYDLRAEYITIDVKNLNDFFESDHIENLDGFNITMPHKEDIIKYLDEITESANEIGCVNTVKIKDGSLMGFNTDGLGARKTLERFIDLDDKRILILGAGGAGKAITYELSKYTEVCVLNRTQKEAKALERFGTAGKKLNFTNLKEEIKRSDILINATSVGMDENVSPVPKEVLGSELIVFDIIYSPMKTKLIREAEEKGCFIMDGLWMLVHQGYKSFQIWTGKEPSIDIIRKTALEKVSS